MFRGFYYFLGSWISLLVASHSQNGRQHGAVMQELSDVQQAWRQTQESTPSPKQLGWAGSGQGPSWADQHPWGLPAMQPP